MANGNVITLDSQNFETEVMQSELPVFGRLLGFLVRTLQDDSTYNMIN